MFKVSKHSVLMLTMVMGKGIQTVVRRQTVGVRVAKRQQSIVANQKRQFFGRGHPPDFDPSKDYYKVLEVKQSATQQEIKNNYYRLAQFYHPDRNSGNSIAYDLSQASTWTSSKKSQGLIKSQETRQRESNMISLEALGKLELGVALLTGRELPTNMTRRR